MIEDFMKWKQTTLHEFDKWQEKFEQEALKQGTYQKANNWLDKQNISLLGHSATTVEDHFNYAVRQMIEDGKADIRHKAMNSEVKEVIE